MLTTDVLIVITIAAFAALTATAVAVTLNNEALERIYAVRLLIGPQNTQYVKIGGDIGLASGNMQIGLKDANDVVILAGDEPTLTITANGQLTARSEYTPATSNALVTLGSLSMSAASAGFYTGPVDTTVPLATATTLTGGNLTLDAASTSDFEVSAHFIRYIGTTSKKFSIRSVLVATSSPAINGRWWMSVNGGDETGVIIQSSIFTDETIRMVNPNDTFSFKAVSLGGAVTISVYQKRLTLVEIK
jgi:hypothetical protein